MDARKLNDGIGVFAWAMLILAISAVVCLPSAAECQTLIGSPFITGYDGWTDTFDYSSNPQRGGWPGWGVLLYNDTLSEVADGAQRLGGTYSGGTAGDGQYKPYMMVNSQETPSAYTLIAKLSSHDDDGLGLVFGYQDNNNYFRVGSRPQATGSYGFCQGLSIDKVVGGSTTQVVTPDPGFLNYSDNTPFYIKVTVDGTSYSVSAWNEGEGEPFIPIFSGSDTDLTTLGAGQYGVMSWCNKIASTATNTAWGTQLHQLDVTSTSVNRTHTFTNVWPMNWQKLTMTRSDGVQNLQRSATDEGNFRLDFRNGTILENSDAFEYSVSSGPTQNIDFISPAIFLDETAARELEDIEFKIRLTCGDNEGPSVLLRVQQDATDSEQVSFYRVNFGASAFSTTYTGRCPKGLSIQKCVAGGTGSNPTWTELYRDDQADIPFVYTDFTSLPRDAVPFDLKVKVINDETDSSATIYVEVIDDPDGAATKYVWDPVVDDTNPLLTGSVGLASWGNSSFTSGVRGFGVVYGGYGGDPNAPLVVVPTTVPEIPGDADSDGDVDMDDAAMLAGGWGTATGATWAMGDFDKDGDVDAADASIFAANYGYVYSRESGVGTVPEPGTIALVLSALIGMVAFRRHK